MGKPKKNAPANQPSDYLKYDLGKPYWTMMPDGKGVLQKSETGIGSVVAETLPQLMERAVKRNGNKIFTRTENEMTLARGATPPEAKPLDEWKKMTYKQFDKVAKNTAKAMIASGFKPHDACNIWGFNSPEWFVGMYAAIYAGGKAAGIYPSDTPDQFQFKSDHSNGSICFVETQENYEKLQSKLSELPYLKAVVCWACEAGSDLDGGRVKTYNYKDFVKFGAKQSDEGLDKIMANIEADDCCALIYTSGTTGQPKAVMISHDNLYYEAMTVLKGAIGVIGNKNEEERILSYLPLSHIAGMMIDVVCPVVISGCMKGWCTVHFARPYDLKRGTIGDRLKTVRPTLFFGVPRVWEKIQEKLLAVGAAMPDGILKKLSAAAKKRSAIYQKGQQLGGDGKKPKSLALFNVLLKKIKGKLGLDKAKFVFAGAAPMTPACLEYFGSIGFNINEVYGMSESTGAVTWSNDKYHTWGSVGFELPGTEVKIFKVGTDGTKSECPAAQNIYQPSEAEQGEICFRGRNVMMGYMANERLGTEHMETIEKKNMEAIDNDGWLHSGDKGTKDIHGMVKITGRYKELIIGAGGENIAPVPIEDEMKRLCPFISNIMMVGNKRKFNVALITLKAVGATGELPGGNELEKVAQIGSSKTIEEAMKDTVVINAITEAIMATNKNPKVVPSNAAKIQKFTILPRDFSVMTNELTATLKLKRSVVDDKYMAIIDAMYETKEAYVPYSTAPSALQAEDAESVIEVIPQPDVRNLSIAKMELNAEELKLEAEAAAEDDA
mmetsp:Transcript_10654/g.13907  ORF Transcript_10654/g.13907 Transcript_10654/m.13907 type:complete len:779 (+) Transcript_10654:250-2586(+)|eukprot:CAMPEP_0204860748 /NCGR_PEP_ID=MMETSP1348-20121228/818_1 /ASSEMBLY_ACC=CAM_ASM_000700 /TAXON_ID=215587 /ORGANISM="Aplanochytrium stocchinoi, Strain GSBS06" /LENGTH=778 /DNA_ID=CAMNT_0052009671 /DNA_START=158 /DNA_END=2494 /DNA_ORIENTATION=-